MSDNVATTPAQIILSCFYSRRRSYALEQVAKLRSANASMSMIDEEQERVDRLTRDIARVGKLTDGVKSVLWLIVLPALGLANYNLVVPFVQSSWWTAIDSIAATLVLFVAQIIWWALFDLREFSFADNDRKTLEVGLSRRSLDKLGLLAFVAFGPTYFVLVTKTVLTFIDNLSPWKSAIVIALGDKVFHPILWAEQILVIMLPFFVLFTSVKIYQHLKIAKMIHDYEVKQEYESHRI